MRRFSVNDVVLKVLGLLLLTAAVLKGHELLTVPVANKNFGSWRPFLIFQVESELALGIWLLSGVFKRLAWVAALLCFSLFCGVTLYKGLSGAASCGCFGRVHINPWITLMAVDFPAVVAMSLFRPAGLFGPALTLVRRQESIRGMVRDLLKPSAISFRVVATAGFTLVVLSTTMPVLALNKPASVTSTYEVLEPETWVGKELPILEYIDIGEQLRQGTWLLLFFHHDCPDCQVVIPRYEQIAQDWGSTQGFLQIALIEVPPYGSGPIKPNSPCSLGRLSNVKEWFVATPTTALVRAARVSAVWVQGTTDTQAIFARLATSYVRNSRTPVDSHQGGD
jgi:thiol-disulfide isomerase/thioredoxin